MCTSLRQSHPGYRTELQKMQQGALKLELQAVSYQGADALSKLVIKKTLRRDFI
jgi:hypothetical protein